MVDQAQDVEPVDDLEARCEAILDALFRRDHVTAGHVAYVTGMEGSALYTALSQLVDRGQVVPETEPEPTGHRNYRRTFYSLT